MGPPLRGEESDYYWSLLLYWGVTVLALTLTRSLHIYICDYSLQLTNFYLISTFNFVFRSIKFSLAFASTVIPDFSLLEIHDEDLYSLLDSQLQRQSQSYFMTACPRQSASINAKPLESHNQSIFSTEPLRS
jgi:hypothetical protein